MPGFHHAILNERTLGGRLRALPESPLDIQLLLNQLKGPEELPALNAFMKLFCCYRPVSSSGLFCLEIMRDAVLDEHLEISGEFISLPPKLTRRLKEIGGKTGRVVESAEHQGMKAWVRDFLRSKAIRVPDDEISMLGYRVDVGALRERVFVECGDTEPRKVFEFLREMLPIGLLPYNSEVIVWLRPKGSFPEFAVSRAKGFLP